jgi:hypothetical protein
MHLYGVYAGGVSSSTSTQPAAPPSALQYYTAPLSYGHTYAGGGAPASPFAPPPISATGPAYGNMYDGHGVSSSLFPSSPVSSLGPVLFAHLLTVKLSADNFLFWKAQIGPLLCSYDLMGYVDGSYPCPPDRVLAPVEGGRMVLLPNPEHRAWIKQDQAILSAIVGFLTPSVSGLVLFANTARDAWAILTMSFNSQTTARSMQIHNKLGQMKKRDLSAHVFFNQVKSAADSLASIGQPLRDSEFAGFILKGLIKSMMVSLKLSRAVKLLSLSRTSFLAC